MASFDLIRDNGFENIDDYFKSEFFKSKMFINNKLNNNKLDKQIIKDMSRSWKQVINGIKFNFDIDNLVKAGNTSKIDEYVREEYKNIINYSMNYIPDKLNILKFNLIQSDLASNIECFYKIIDKNKYLILTNYDPKDSIKYIYLFNNNIIIESELCFPFLIKTNNGIIVTDIGDNGKSGSICFRKYINFNENKVILTVKDLIIGISEQDKITLKSIGLDIKDLYLFRNQINSQNNSQMINYIFYKVINLNLHNIFNNIQRITDLIKNVKNNTRENIKYISYQQLLDSLKRKLFLNNYNNRTFSLEINTEKESETNFFIYDNIIYITEYYFNIIVIIRGENISIGIIYVYNIVNFENNTYKINFHIKSINIRNFLKLKLISKRVQNVNIVLNNILQLYDNNFIKLKINSIINKIEINRTIINNTLNKITKTLPNLKKNYFSEKKSDVLLISFNENGQLYNYKDCLPIIIKILIEKPKIIILSTQETIEHVTNARSFRTLQSFLGKFFLKDSSYKVIIGEIIDSLGYIEKSPIRSITRITRDRVFHNISNKTKIYFIDTVKLEDNEPVIEVIKNERYIISKIDFTYLKISYKIAIVNCNLSIENNHIEFHSMLASGNLLELNQSYDIFFCGNMNLKFISKIENVTSYEIFKKNYLNEQKNQFYQIFGSTNESNIFYSKLLDSINFLGRHLTSPYFRRKSEEEIELYNKIYSSNFNRTNPAFGPILDIDIAGNRTIYLPTDRILFLLKNDTNIDINSKNFDVHFFPDKSSHKMLSLTFNLTRRNTQIRNNSANDLPHIAINALGNNLYNTCSNCNNSNKICRCME